MIYLGREVVAFADAEDQSPGLWGYGFALMTFSDGTQAYVYRACLTTDEPDKEAR